MTGQQLITEVEILRGAIKTSEKGVLNRIFDLNDHLTSVRAKRNCVNCATECLARLMQLAKKFRNEQIPMKSIISPSTIKGQTKKLEQYNIVTPFRPFGHKKTYDNFNTTDAEVEGLLKIEPQHLLRFTLADGSPVVLNDIGKKRKKAVKKDNVEESKTDQ